MRSACWMRVLSRAALLALLLTGNPSCAWCQTAPVPDVTGLYRRIGPASVTLAVSTRDGIVQARLDGGGLPATDGSVPADCTVQGAGRIQNNMLNVMFQPVATDTFSYSATQAKTEKRRLIIAFTAESADVQEADTDGYCGLGIEFRGTYLRSH